MAFHGQGGRTDRQLGSLAVRPLSPGRREHLHPMTTREAEFGVRADFPGPPPGQSALDRVFPMRADLWRDRDVFVTGHTGFKGAWLAVLLTRLGARVHGFALETPNHFLFHRAGVSALLASDVRGDIRDAA